MAGDWATFNWEDPFLIDSELDDEERMVRDSARQYAQDKLLPRVRQAFRDEHTDRAIFNEMGALGLLGATIQGYGCPGVNYVSYGLIAREVERVDSGFRSMMSVQSSLVMYPIYTYGTEARVEARIGDLVASRNFTSSTIYTGATIINICRASPIIIAIFITGSFSGISFYTIITIVNFGCAAPIIITILDAVI